MFLLCLFSYQVSFTPQALHRHYDTREKRIVIQTALNNYNVHLIKHKISFINAYYSAIKDPD